MVVNQRANIELLFDQVCSLRLFPPKRAQSLTEWINGLHGGLGHNVITSAKLVFSCYSKEILDPLHQVHGHQTQLFIGSRNRNPLLSSHILLFHHIMRDDGATVVLRGFPC